MKRLVSLVAVHLFCAGAALASNFSPIALGPITHNEAQIVVVAPDGEEVVYRPADLEGLTTYRLTTRTPWRDKPAAFDGIMLTELLEAGGLGEAPSIRVTAENDYHTVITRDVIDSVPILIATRVDGAAHSRRARGPIQFVLDMDDFEASPLTSEGNYVWMVARIEAGE